MSEVSRRALGLDEFLAWEDRQEPRFELVDGQPSLMGGGTQAHVLIAANIVALLRANLRGTPCRPSGSDLRMPIPATGNSRYPDVTIDCGRFDPAARDATEPAAVFEVLSDSTGWYDLTRKLRDYDSVASVRHYICVSQSERRVLVWRRDSAGRLVPDDVLLGGVLELDLGSATPSLDLDDIYEGAAVPELTASPSSS